MFTFISSFVQLTLTYAILIWYLESSNFRTSYLTSVLQYAYNTLTSSKVHLNYYVV